jgi:hypothetical protein
MKVDAVLLGVLENVRTLDTSRSGLPKVASVSGLTSEFFETLACSFVDIGSGLDGFGRFRRGRRFVLGRDWGLKLARQCECERDQE